MGNVEINKTARREEIFAYTVLAKKIFHDKKVLIGDNLTSNCPDVYSEDKAIGLEVVTCETFNTYKQVESLKLGNVYKRACPTDEFRAKKIVQLNLGIPEEEEYYNLFESALISKLDNLNSKWYKGCQKLYLAIVSTAEKNFKIDYSYMEKLSKHIFSQYEKTYEKTFLIIDNSIKEIDKDGSFINPQAEIEK